MRQFPDSTVARSLRDGGVTARTIQRVRGLGTRVEWVERLEVAQHDQPTVTIVVFTLTAGGFKIVGNNWRKNPDVARILRRHIR